VKPRSLQQACCDLAIAWHEFVLACAHVCRVAQILDWLTRAIEDITPHA
jgi:hypothetical protein